MKMTTEDYNTIEYQTVWLNVIVEATYDEIPG